MPALASAASDDVGARRLVPASAGIGGARSRGREARRLGRSSPRCGRHAPPGPRQAGLAPPAAQALAHVIASPVGKDRAPGPGEGRLVPAPLVAWGDATGRWEAHAGFRWRPGASSSGRHSPLQIASLSHSRQLKDRLGGQGFGEAGVARPGESHWSRSVDADAWTAPPRNRRLRVRVRGGTRPRMTSAVEREREQEGHCGGCSHYRRYCSQLPLPRYGARRTPG